MEMDTGERIFPVKAMNAAVEHFDMTHMKVTWHVSNEQRKSYFIDTGKRMPSTAQAEVDTTKLTTEDRQYLAEFLGPKLLNGGRIEIPPRVSRLASLTHGMQGFEVIRKLVKTLKFNPEFKHVKKAVG